MRTDINQLIAEKIIQAQMASDAGKGIYRLSLKKRPHNRGPQHYGYNAKEFYELNALYLIRSNKTDFNYWVQIEPDQNGYKSVVVYVDFMIDEKRFQISFHNHRVSDQLTKLVGSGRKTRWNKKIGGSFAACLALKEYYDL